MNLFRLFGPTKTLIKQTPTRAICTTNKLNLFHEKDDRGGYPTRPLPPFNERMSLGWSELKKEVKIWCGEVKELLDGDPIRAWRPGETDIAWRFKSEDSLDKWIVTSDSDHNEGSSHCTLERNMYGNAVFSGHISLQVPKDGQVKRAGYCNIKTMRARKSFKRATYLNWIPYNTMVMKVKGDGRTYLLSISTRGFYDITWNDVYNYQLYTRGGPYWQIAKIPFSKFFFSAKGRIQDKQFPITLDKVASFGITAQDRHGGDFKLEIDYIGLEYDPKHVEEFAYEEYKMETGIVD
ncbi:complex I intermediate-associated protein 30, mitochondrial [Anthonomus grandis grandis]|uniref:complex I intermediate-associated protein 30, mitochondrial n=1 Tax=Anthonomus grandis grandis TaxID=2921223 RepID=UPI002165BDA0|nr:complex I intermediate-associated protein 30, mitochondrial [Anthonomus grandis grandis]